MLTGIIKYRNDISFITIYEQYEIVGFITNEKILFGKFHYPFSIHDFINFWTITAKKVKQKWL